MTLRHAADAAECEITVNGSRILRVPSGRPLLETLHRRKIFIPTACGGHGACGYCKLKVPNAPGPMTPAEIRLLTREQIAAGFRLSCQVIVRGDLAIEVPDAILAIRECRARVERIRDLNYDTKELRVRLIDPPEVSFEPGQYMQLAIPAPGVADGSIYRAYSMSSPPSHGDTLEFIVRLVPGGIGSTWVFASLKEQDEVVLHGPCGDFRLSDSAREMFWIAGGSGMAPFWSFARHLVERRSTRRCTYFFGAVSRRDLMLVDEFRAVERALPSFRFVPALSKPDPADAWDGETGLVTEVAGRYILRGTEAEAYLCGSPTMIHAAISVLHAKGIADSRIFFDRFS